VHRRVVDPLQHAARGTAGDDRPTDRSERTKELLMSAEVPASSGDDRSPAAVDDQHVAARPHVLSASVVGLVIAVLMIMAVGAMAISTTHPPAPLPVGAWG
jgi:hypothetical protein